MIYKAEINPRDHEGYFAMIASLQAECFRLFGVGFDNTCIQMGVLSENSEMCWFKGLIDDGKMHIETKKRFYEHTDKSAICWYSEFIPEEYPTSSEMMEAMRRKCNSEHGTSFNEKNYTIYQLVPHSQIYCIYAYVPGSGKAEKKSFKEHMTNAMTKAINDFWL